MKKGKYIKTFKLLLPYLWPKKRKDLRIRVSFAVVQGSAFGLEGFFRISYATSMENLKKALEKISTFCKSLN